MPLFSRRPRRQRVVVAVVYDPRRQKFLVVFNPRWGGYTFPLRRQRRTHAPDAVREREHAVEDARQALLEDLGPALGRAADAHWMDRIAVEGTSGRTGEPTLYAYDIVTLTLADPLPDGVFAGPYGFLSADEIRQADPDEPGANRRAVTWTTWQVLTKLLDNQQVAVAVVSRNNDGRREFLMTRNRHGKWFFPATRMGDQVPARRALVYEFKLKANYTGPVEVAEDGLEVELEQQTAHLGPRRYTFHLHRTAFPQEDLTLPGNRLEGALDGAHVEFAWKGEEDLVNPSPDLSDTVAGLRDAVLRLA